MSNTWKLPKVICGTSGLGNLYVAISDETKLEIVKAFVESNTIHQPIVFDCAGKYGAGLALETLGHCLQTLDIKPENVVISNKLGWYRTHPLPSGAEPTFEPGVWRDLKYDATQKISYHGILECYAQGNQLLNGYKAELVSVHDPDEYIAGAENQQDAEKRYHDIIDAYGALFELKSRNEVKAVGVGAKDWKIIRRIANDIKLDWVMIANSMTVHSHPPDLIAFMKEMQSHGIHIINSALFNGGFLIGEDYYNYKLMDPIKDQSLFYWRTRFFQLCDRYGVKPAHVCIIFGLYVPGVQSIAISSSNPTRIKENLSYVIVDHGSIPPSFWKEMQEYGLIDKNYAMI